MASSMIDETTHHMKNRKNRRSQALHHRHPHFAELQLDTGALIVFGGGTLVYLLGVFILQRLPFFSLPFGYTTFGDKPIPTLIIGYALFAVPVALSLLAASALHCHKGMGVLFYFIMPPLLESFLLPRAEQFPQQFDQIRQIWTIYIVATALYELWGIFVWWQIYQYRKPPEKSAPFDTPRISGNDASAQTTSRDIPRLSLGLTVTLSLILFVLVFARTLVFYFSMNTKQIAFDNLQGLLICVAIGLIPVYMLAGTDYAEISEVAAEHIIHSIGKKRIPLKLAIFSACCSAAVLLGDCFFIRDLQNWGLEIGIGILIALLGWLPVQLVISLGRLRRYAPSPIPVGVALLGIFLSIFPLTFGVITRDDKLTYVFTVAFFASVLTLLFAFGIWLVRRLPPEVQVNLALQGITTFRWRYLFISWLFLMMVIVASVLAFIRIEGHNGMEGIIAIATLVSIPFFLQGRNHLKKIKRNAALFILSSGLVVLSGLSFILSYFSVVAESLAIGVVLVTVALGWDMFMSWHVVRRHSKEFPHLTRPLLLTSYVVLSSTVITFLGDYPLPIHTTPTDAIAAFFHYPFDHIPWVLLGMMILGYSSLVIHFPMEIGGGEFEDELK